MKILTNLFLLAMLILTCLPNKASAQQESILQKQERESYTQFFQLNRTRIKPNFSVLELTKKQDQLQKTIKKGNNKLAEFERLIKTQETIKSNSTMEDFIMNDPTFASASVEVDPDFAQVILWNKLAMQIAADDHTADVPGSGLTTHPFEQPGPARTSRAMAIVHISIFEALNTIYKLYNSYSGLQSKILAHAGVPSSFTSKDVSAQNAIAYAAYKSLLALYPFKKFELDLALNSNLVLIRTPSNTQNLGDTIGSAAATEILKLRYLDGSELPDPPSITFQTTDPNKWQQDPLNPLPNSAYGANWKYVKPFVVQTADQFRLQLKLQPLRPDDPKYIDAFNEAKDYGGDPSAGTPTPPGNGDRQPTATKRTIDQTFTGHFWAYDGTALLCAPPRLYNMIATSIALKEERSYFMGNTAAIDLARYLALVNVAMADAGISAWESKYYFLYPRPVTAIRLATPLTAPIKSTNEVKFWAPLGAPVTNADASKVNFTPNFPSYPSGHATFGGALFEIFRKFYNSDNIKFEFVSDEYNGLNYSPGATTPRPLTPQTFNTFTEAEWGNAISRLYLGIHWRFDSTDGIALGNKVADYVFDNSFGKIK